MLYDVIPVHIVVRTNKQGGTMSYFCRGTVAIILHTIVAMQ